MLNLSFWNLLFTVINVIVLYLLLNKFLIGPVTAIMEKRETMIKNQLDHAKNTEDEAVALKEQWDEEMKQVHGKSSEILENAKKTAKNEYDKILKEADKEAEKIMKDAHKKIELEREKTLHDVQTEIADLAMAAATKIIAEHSNEQMNQSMYDQFLAKAGESHDTNNG